MPQIGADRRLGPRPRPRPGVIRAGSSTAGLDCPGRLCFLPKPLLRARLAGTGARPGAGAGRRPGSPREPARARAGEKKRFRHPESPELGLRGSACVGSLVAHPLAHDVLVAVVVDPAPDDDAAVAAVAAPAAPAVPVAIAIAASPLAVASPFV